MSFAWVTLYTFTGLIDLMHLSDKVLALVRVCDMRILLCMYAPLDEDSARRMEGTRLSTSTTAERVLVRVLSPHTTSEQELLRRE